MEEVKLLLEYYQKQLENINLMIKDLKFKDDANPTYIRYTTKRSCYQTLILELLKIISKTV